MNPLAENPRIFQPREHPQYHFVFVALLPALGMTGRHLGVVFGQDHQAAHVSNSLAVPGLFGRFILTQQCQ